MIHVSDCCNVPSDVDHEICSRCGEHCEILTDDTGRDWLVTSVSEDCETDYIPGYDDGEWDPVMGDEDAPETDDAWLDEFWGEEDFA